MQYLQQFLLFCNFGTDYVALLKVSGILTAALVFSVVIIGSIMNGIQTCQMHLLARFLGQRFALTFCNRITFVGTIIHECSHAFFMIITGAKITEFSVWDSGGDSLGHVSYYNRGPLILRAFQDSLSACAPVIVGLAIEFVIWHFIMHGNLPIWADILLWYAFISIIDHMSMSSADLGNYFKGIWAVAIVLFIAIFCLCFIATV